MTLSRSKEQDTAKNNSFHPTRGIFWAVRTRILCWYILFMIFIFIIFIPIFREVLYTRVDSRVRRELAEKIETF
ncbi:hypothetical protein ACE1AT_27445 [Pelatocladus sp. BLCC-F211]|uniref:hypothetical protein n=1 Tax=Pelatocladus sp. BLCC-F211 TaxID=3342752 RepID=UPI0035BA0336